MKEKKISFTNFQIIQVFKKNFAGHFSSSWLNSKSKKIINNKIFSFKKLITKEFKGLLKNFSIKKKVAKKFFSYF